MKRFEKGDESGFSMLELMIAIVIGAVMMSVAVLGTKSYFQVRALQGGQDQVVSQMRNAQQRAMSESYPNVYGVRFQTGTNKWSVVKVNAAAATPTCTVVYSYTFEGGTTVDALGTTFPAYPAGTGTWTTACQVATPGNSANDKTIFFLPSGGSSAASPSGSSVKLINTKTGKFNTTTVMPLTGRVVRS
ncbi:MAG: type II secretion system GspH family protein [Actinomycetota bacterium]|nr:type II secretion system GspH family protein [Actinomycetota bacterium]